MIALEVAGSPFTVAENTFGRLFVRTRPIRLLDPSSSIPFPLMSTTEFGDIFHTGEQGSACSPRILP